VVTCQLPLNDVFLYCLTADYLWRFCEILDDAIDIFVPFVMIDSSQGVKPRGKRYPRHIQKLIARKCSLWRQRRLFPDNIILRAQYNNVSKECKSAIQRFELSLEKKVIDANNSGQFFKYVKKKLGRSHEVGILKTASGENAITDQSKANTLNSFFSLVNARDNNEAPEYSPRVNESTMLDNIQFRPETIVKLTKKIKPKLSQGPDGYSSYLLTKIVPAIVEPVSMMYQSFMSVGRIPMMWKSAIITSGVNEPERTGTAFRLEFMQPERCSCSSVTVFENA